MKNKTVGVFLIIGAVLFSVSLVIYNMQINSLTRELMVHYGGNCIINGECIHQRSKLPIYIGIGIVSFLLALGIYLLFFGKKVKNIDTKLEIPKNLDEEEKKILDILNSKNGSVYQSDLIKETGYSKVKVTRILDKLEHKKIIDRKRRGMANIVVLR